MKLKRLLGTEGRRGSMGLLELHDVEIAYGNIQVVKGINLSVKGGEIVTLLGANGAGKTTTLQAISGLLRLKSGIITFNNEEIQTMPAHKIVELGICHVPEGR